MVEFIIQWLAAPVAAFGWAWYFKIDKHETSIAVLEAQILSGKLAHNREIKTSKRCCDQYRLRWTVSSWHCAKGDLSPWKQGFISMSTYVVSGGVIPNVLIFCCRAIHHVFGWVTLLQLAAWVLPPSPPRFLHLPNLQFCSRPLWVKRPPMQ